MFWISKHKGGPCTHYTAIIFYVQKHHECCNSATKVYTCVTNVSSRQIMSEQVTTRRAMADR